MHPWVPDRARRRFCPQLDVVAEGVNELRNIALTMRDEVKVQTAMVDEITQKVRTATAAWRASQLWRCDDFCVPLIAPPANAHATTRNAGGFGVDASQHAQQEDEEDTRIDTVG